MNSPDLRRYGREVKRSVRGFRLRKRLTAAFRRSLVPLLEEVPSPSYEDLLDALGPPEHLADALLQTIELPRPIPLWKKLALCACALLAAFAVGFGAFSLWNAPEEETFFPDPANYTRAFLQENYSSVASEAFSHSDVDWDQPGEMEAYLLVLENTNRVPTKVYVTYSKHQPSHTIEVDPGETVLFVVNDPRPGPHSVAFTTPDGTLAGTVRVLLSDAPLPLP